MIKRQVSIILLYNDNRKVLLQHRDKNMKRLPNYWAFFGGGIEKGENPLDALKKEIKEELAYHVSRPQKILTQKFQGVNYYGSKHVFLEKVDPKQSLKQQEGDDMKWVKVSEALEMKMFEHDKEVVRYLEKFWGNQTEGDDHDLHPLRPHEN